MGRERWVERERERERWYRQRSVDRGMQTQVKNDRDRDRDTTMEWTAVATISQTDTSPYSYDFPNSHITHSQCPIALHSATQTANKQTKSSLQIEIRTCVTIPKPPWPKIFSGINRLDNTKDALGNVWSIRSSPSSDIIALTFWLWSKMRCNIVLAIAMLEVCSCAIW